MKRVAYFHDLSLRYVTRKRRRTTHVFKRTVVEQMFVLDPQSSEILCRVKGLRPALRVACSGMRCADAVATVEFSNAGL